MIAFWVHYFIKSLAHRVLKSGTGVYEPSGMREHYRKTSRVKVASTLRYIALELYDKADELRKIE